MARLLRHTLVASIIALPALAAAAGEVLAAARSPAVLPRLERGEIVVSADPANPADTAVAAVKIDAPVERVWAVMTDCPRTPEFVPNLRRCRVLEQRPDGRLLEHRMKPHALVPVLTYRVEEKWQALRQIAFRRVGGDLAAMEGSWDLEPAGEATLVRYRVKIDPGFPVPGWAIRRALRHDIPRLLSALRERVEGRRELSR